MGDDGSPTGGGAVVVGTVQLSEKDLLVPIVEMSWLFRMRWLYVIAVIGTAAGLVLLRGSDISVDQGWSVLLFFAVFVGFMFVAPRITARRVHRALTSAAGGDSGISYRFDGEGVTIRASGSTTTFAYRRLVKVREGKTALLLYTSPVIASIVPKRAFTPEGLTELRALLPTHAKPVRVGFPLRVVLVWLVLVLVVFVIWKMLETRPI